MTKREAKSMATVLPGVSTPARCKARRKDDDGYMRKADSNELICLRCDKFFFKRLKDRQHVNDIITDSPECLEQLAKDFGLIGLVFCPACVSLVREVWQTMRSVNPEVLQAFLFTCARDLLSGNAVSENGQCLIDGWRYTTCRIIYDLDKTSKAMANKQANN